MIHFNYITLSTLCVNSKWCMHKNNLKSPGKKEIHVKLFIWDLIKLLES